MSDSGKKSDPPITPVQTADDEPPTELPHGVDMDSLTSQADMLEVAKDFLNDDAIKLEPRERKVEFLKQKGLKQEDIDKLLGAESEGATTETASDADIKTVHDSTTHTRREDTGALSQSHQQSQPIATKPSPTPEAPQREMPPIITYPEFLLKPQKPPPLVTVQRLLDATYVLAGLSALTYGASKYLVEPMVQTLTEARHDLAEATLEDLKKLNTKLEGSVSHVPYTASAAALKAQHSHISGDDDDVASVDSDPTELFHRDVATQTSPQLSRSPSASASGTKKPDLNDVTNTQTLRLESLHTTLEGLVSSLSPTPAPFMPPTSGKKLHDTVAAFQSLLDKLESTYNPFRSDYVSTYPSLSGTTSQNRTKSETNEAVKFKTEIRALKGAFLSSRNFPAAPRPQTFSNYGPTSH